MGQGKLKESQDELDVLKAELDLLKDEEELECQKS